MNALAAARRFRAAHHGQQPLVLPNVWDCASARAFAEAGFGALATSSSAVAAVLGYADGQQTPAAEMFAAIARIARCVTGMSTHRVIRAMAANISAAGVCWPSA